MAMSSFLLIGVLLVCTMVRTAPGDEHGPQAGPEPEYQAGEVVDTVTA
jgi:hypothetical protein